MSHHHRALSKIFLPAIRRTLSFPSIPFPRLTIFVLVAVQGLFFNAFATFPCGSPSEGIVMTPKRVPAFFLVTPPHHPLLHSRASSFFALVVEHRHFPIRSGAPSVPFRFFFLFLYFSPAPFQHSIHNPSPRPFKSPPNSIPSAFVASLNLAFVVPQDSPSLAEVFLSSAAQVMVSKRVSLFLIGPGFSAHSVALPLSRILFAGPFSRRHGGTLFGKFGSRWTASPQLDFFCAHVPFFPSPLAFISVPLYIELWFFFVNRPQGIIYGFCTPAPFLSPV